MPLLYLFSVCVNADARIPKHAYGGQPWVSVLFFHFELVHLLLAFRPQVSRPAEFLGTLPSPPPTSLKLIDICAVHPAFTLTLGIQT